MGRHVYYSTDEEINKILEMFKEGAYMSEIATYFGITRQGLYERMKRDPKLFDAIKKGRDFSLAWHEASGRRGIHDKDFNSSAWYMIMRNKHGWHNKQFEEKNNKGIELEGNSIVEKIKDLSNKVEKNKITLTAAQKQLPFLELQLASEMNKTVTDLKSMIKEHLKNETVLD